jgi:hypothetical protein
VPTSGLLNAPSSSNPGESDLVAAIEIMVVRLLHVIRVGARVATQ